MITYKVTPLFQADWSALYPALFGENVHCASKVEGNVAEFSFEDNSVKPKDLGPMVVITPVLNNVPDVVS